MVAVVPSWLRYARCSDSAFALLYSSLHTAPAFASCAWLWRWHSCLYLFPRPPSPRSSRIPGGCRVYLRVAARTWVPQGQAGAPPHCPTCAGGMAPWRAPARTVICFWMAFFFRPFSLSALNSPAVHASSRFPSRRRKAGFLSKWTSTPNDPGRSWRTSKPSRWRRQKRKAKLDAVIAQFVARVQETSESATAFEYYMELDNMLE